jgi:hypothetical protein
MTSKRWSIISNKNSTLPFSLQISSILFILLVRVKM